MIKVEFNTDIIDILEYERYHHPHPIVQKKMEALYLKSQGMAHKDICRICRIARVTLASYLKQYRDGGVERLKQLGYKGQPSALNAHRASLEEHFRKNPPRNTAEAQVVIEGLTGIRRSPTQVRAFMKRMGMKSLKVGFVPGKAANSDKLAEQENFLEKELEPRLAEAKEGKRAVYFMDAAHFVHGAFLGMIWCFARLFIPSPSGRKRFNVLGALNAVTKEVVAVSNETYINSQSVCELLLQIAQRCSAKPVTIILDNARYQRCSLVQGFAANLGIELLFLPSYSPNLNLIERFWRFVKKKCLYSKSYSNFMDFKTAIAQCIQQAPFEDSEKLESLLAWNFQSFQKVNISTV
jgi:transposase